MDHATERIVERLTDAGASSECINKVFTLVNALPRYLPPTNNAAVCVLTLPDRVNEAWGERSNGNQLWAIIRGGVVKTVMLRRDTQPATTSALRVDAVFYAPGYTDRFQRLSS